jgi:hypothetical protein
VDGTGDVGRYNAIAADASDCLHLGYYDRANGDLKYAHRTHPVACDDDPSVVAPAALRLIAVHPNPARVVATAIWSTEGMGTPMPVSLRVYDSLGRLVARPTLGRVTGGTGAGRWDLRTNAGLPVGPGVYLLRLKAGSGTTSEAAKLIVVR